MSRSGPLVTIPSSDVSISTGLVDPRLWITKMCGKTSVRKLVKNKFDDARWSTRNGVCPPGAQLGIYQIHLALTPITGQKQSIVSKKFSLLLSCQKIVIGYNIWLKNCMYWDALVDLQFLTIITARQHGPIRNTTQWHTYYQSHQPSQLEFNSRWITWKIGATCLCCHVSRVRFTTYIIYDVFLALVLPDQVSESIIQFSRVKPLAGPDRPDMESQWLTPFKTKIFCNPKGLWLWFGDICQWAPIATRCEALGKVPSMKFVTITMKTKPASSLALVVKISKVSLYAFDSTRTNLLHF